MTTVPSRLQRELRSAGFRSISSETYLFGPTIDGIEHGIMFMTMRGALRGGVSVSVGVRSIGVEARLACAFRCGGLGWLADALLQSRGWMVGIWLGNAAPQELAWNSALYRIAEPGMSISDAVAQMRTVQSVESLYRVAARSLPEWQKWVPADVQSELRKLVAMEILISRYSQPEDSYDLQNIQRALERSHDRAYTEFLRSHPFPELRRLIRECSQSVALGG